MDTTNKSLSQCNESDNYRYISHVDLVSMLRDSYKENTQNTLNDRKAELEQECERKTQQAEKVLTLLNHSHLTVNQLNSQRKSTGKTLEQLVKQANLLAEQIRQETRDHMQALEQSELAMRSLLNELRPRNT